VNGASWDALALDEGDDVAVALRDLAAGASVRVRAGSDVETVSLRDAVPMGHKFARRDIAAGADVRKYGNVIGAATAAIARGAHVHVHNLVSRRARKGSG
jgi:altronate dehydratase